MFVYSFQELDLSPEALLRNETNREEAWIDLVESSLKMAGKFKKVKERLQYMYMYSVQYMYLGTCTVQYMYLGTCCLGVTVNLYLLINFKLKNLKICH